MSLVLRHATPRSVERGVDTSLTADVYDAAGGQLTATAGVLTIRDGSEVVVDAAAATSLGPPAAYTLAGSVTSTRGLSERWIEEWTLTISGTAHTFRRAGYLVRHVFYPTLTDTDLYARYSDLADLRDPDQTSYETQREAARERIERDLIKRGKRPWLVFDSWALYDAHLAMTGHIIFNDFATSIGDGRYKEEADRLWEEYQRELDACNFRYDMDESGTVTSETQVSSVGSVILSGSPRRGRWGARWR